MTNNVPNGLKIGSGGLPRGRPREFDVHEVVGAAKELFWEHGYQGFLDGVRGDAKAVAVQLNFAVFEQPGH